MNENFDKAYGYAVYLLSLSLRTEGELREKMRQKKYLPDVVDKVIKQLAENSYLNDQRYAEVYLENLKKYKNFGFYGIKKKLMEKRLPSAIIESVLNDGLTIEEEIKIAKRLLKRQQARGKRGEEKQKTAARLKSRGFRGEVIAKLIF
jgi:regulatory protein